MGAAAQASTHAGQEAEEAQADAHDDARDRVHVQRVWQGRGREQNRSRTGENPRFIDQDILGLPPEATGLNLFLWTCEISDARIRGPQRLTGTTTTSLSNCLPHWTSGS